MKDILEIVVVVNLGQKVVRGREAKPEVMRAPAGVMGSMMGRGGNGFKSMWM